MATRRPKGAVALRERGNALHTFENVPAADAEPASDAAQGWVPARPGISRSNPMLAIALRGGADVALFPRPDEDHGRWSWRALDTRHEGHNASSVMSPRARPRAYLIFTGSGPILALSSYPKLTDERLVNKLRYKGIDKFIAYEVDLDAVEARYAQSYDRVREDLQGLEDVRVLDFNGHQIMANFSLDELGDPIKFGG